MAPTFRYEKRLWRRGYKVVVGADEVGRGAWAGPVVAAAVAFAPETQNVIRLPAQAGKTPAFAEASAGRQNGKTRIDDSKKLSPKQREKAEKWIKENTLCWGIGQASVSEINRLGLGKASKMAFRRAIVECGRTIDFLLIDAFYLPYTKGLRRKSQLAIINGDEKCFSIAAASILAKVWRDKLMQKLSRKHPRYKWNRNKGYGTKEHQEAIRKYGITKLHRVQFVSEVT